MKTILCFGDSNTWGYDAASRDPATGAVERFDWNTRWPGVLQAALGDGFRVIEDALNGRTVVANDAYFPNHRGYPQLLTALDAHAPIDLVILHLGVNELKQHFSLSAGMIALGMEELIKAASAAMYKYPAPKALLIAPAPVPEEIATGLWGFVFGREASQKSRMIGQAYREVARKYGCAFLDAGELGFALNEVDFLHYCAEDHKKLGLAAAKAVRELIG